MNGIGEKVARIGYEEDQAAFDLWKTPNECEFQEQRSRYTNDDSKEETAKENGKKGANTFEEGEYREITTRG